MYREYTLQEGKEVMVHYNPDKPQDSRLFTDTERDFNSGFLSSFIVLILLCIFAGIYWFRRTLCKAIQDEEVSLV